MKIIWLGHGSFRIEIAGEVLLIDPWLTGNPVLPEDQQAKAIEGATHILVTHAHSDHTADVVPISQKTGAPVSSSYELAQHLHAAGAEAGHAFGKGGTIQIGETTASLVPASHSSSFQDSRPDAYMGCEAGYVIGGEGKRIYISGDTGLMADMDWIGDYFKPEIGILCAGGYFTMDMAQATYAAKRYFNFETLIPCHYRTFPLLEQNADAMKAGLPDVDVIEPEVMQPIVL
jgi:L-ascorbate metabolism protein UlaG (beta-lactamase superfamily)